SCDLNRALLAVAFANRPAGRDYRRGAAAPAAIRHPARSADRVASLLYARLDWIGIEALGDVGVLEDVADDEIGGIVARTGGASGEDKVGTDGEGAGGEDVENRSRLACREWQLVVREADSHHLDLLLEGRGIGGQRPHELLRCA